MKIEKPVAKSKNKTAETEKDVLAFIDDFAPSEQKRSDSYALLQLMAEASGWPAKMWGPSIIGFGRYHYRYDSGHEGDAPLIGFSPRKAAISLYVFTGLAEHEHLLEGLGKFKMGKACIYVNKLTDIDLAILSKLMTATIGYFSEKYGVLE